MKSRIMTGLLTAFEYNRTLLRVKWIHLQEHGTVKYCSHPTRNSHNVGHPLQWRHNGHNGVSDHQSHDCLLNRLFRRRSKKTPKLRVTGLCAGNSPVTGEFIAQTAINAVNVSIWWLAEKRLFTINIWIKKKNILSLKQRVYHTKYVIFTPGIRAAYSWLRLVFLFHTRKDM